MSKPIPPVSKFMTVLPHTIGQDQLVQKAREVMREHHIRHLPVLSGQRLVGMITDRDIAIIESFRDINVSTVTVEQAMSQDVYTCDPDKALDEVAADMAERKIGSAVISQNFKVVGIFTAVDAMIALSELLNTRLKK